MGPATGGVVEGRKSTVESVGEHDGVEIIQQNKSFVVVYIGHGLLLRLVDIVQYDGAGNKTFEYSSCDLFTRYYLDFTVCAISITAVSKSVREVFASHLVICHFCGLYIYDSYR